MAQSSMMDGTGEELIQFLNKRPKERFRLIALSNENEIPTYEEMLAKAISRTPEEIAQARARVLALSPSPRELPEGKTLEEVVVGQWPGEESDEEILEALRDLS